MRIKVICYADKVPPTPEGNDSFPANATYHLRMSFVGNLEVTYEPGYPIYGDAGEAAVEQVRNFPWVDSVEIFEGEVLH